MEVAIEDSLPTFSGGLGVLAGDFLRSAADLALPVAGVTLLYRGGYFAQHVDPSGRQSESPVAWTPQDVLEQLPDRVSVEIDGRRVEVGAWRRLIRGHSGHRIPLYLLDTDVRGNSKADRAITDQLYAGDQGHRLRQEAVLGFGGVAMLRALGDEPALFHMNEGHCSLLTLGLLESEIESGSASMERAVDAVRRRCVFTTHTPVPAGHDRFEESRVRSVLGARRSKLVERLGCLSDGFLNMTSLGMHMSCFTNGVSLRHGEVSRKMFPGVPIRSITNGVHAATWVARPFGQLYDRVVPGWRSDNELLRYTSGLDLEELDEAHVACKKELLESVRKANGVKLPPEVLTIGLARRATPYKRTTLLFSDLERLRELVEHCGPMQVLCSGKAHPRDKAGKDLIADLVAASRQLRGTVDIVFLEGYDLALASKLCAGTDVWLNTPEKPHEASGTSGMKAALNGVPSLSVLDGWWVEGCVEGVTGWSIGDSNSAGDDASSLYAKLEDVVIPLFYKDHEGFLAVMRSAISLNGSFFNTERMVREYALSAYRSTVHSHDQRGDPPSAELAPGRSL